MKFKDNLIFSQHMKNSQFLQGEKNDLLNAFSMHSREWFKKGRTFIFLVERCLSWYSGQSFRPLDGTTAFSSAIYLLWIFIGYQLLCFYYINHLTVPEAFS